MNLRDYQEQALEHIKLAMKQKHKHICVYAPTGAGKTVMFCEIALRAISKNPSMEVLIVVDRTVLIDQTVNKLSALGITPRIIHGGAMYADYQRPSNILVTSIQTLNNRLKDNPEYLPSEIKLIIIDECHHSYVSPLRKEKSRYYRLFEWAKSNHSYVLGFTATPERLSKRESLSDTYSTLVQSASFLELLTTGYLCKWEVYSQPNAHLAAQLSKLDVSMGDYDQKGLGKIMSSSSMIKYTVNEWLKLSTQLATQLSTIAFVVNQDHAKALCEAFLSEGIKAAIVIDSTPLKERQRLYHDLATKKLTVLISVGVLSEGFDVPSVELGLMARPTASRSIYIQQFGRILRPHQGKDVARLLDITANYATHGCPSSYDPYKAFYKESSTKETGEALMKNCKNCLTALPIQAKYCHCCGYVFPIKMREYVPTNTSLVNIVSTLRYTKFDSINTPRGFMQNHLVQALNRGYNLDWAKMQFKDAYGRYPTLSETSFVLFGESPTDQQAHLFLNALYLIARNRHKDYKWIRKWLRSQTNLDIKTEYTEGKDTAENKP